MGDINLLGVGGIIAALIGLVLYGRSLGRKSMEGKLAKSDRERERATIQKEVAQKTSQATVETAKEQSKAESDYQTVQKALEEAQKTDNEEEAKRIAAETAQKAIEKGASSR